MKFSFPISVLVLLPLMLSSCDSSKSTESDGAPDFDISSIGDYKGIANGTVTIGGKAHPIEFTADAYSKQMSLTGFTDLAHQDSGWKVFIAAKASTTAPQDIGAGWNQVVLGHYAHWDSLLCGYGEKAGTVTIESFVAKKSGTTNYFITSGKASFTATRSSLSPGSAATCPEITVEVTFSQILVHDSGLNL